MNTHTESDLASLLGVTQEPAARALAARYAPILRFDAHEPFVPLAAGYTLFHHSGLSPSFRQGHRVELEREGHPPASLAIEYAIWWDWDIGHLYELEHVWVFVGADGRVVRGEASWHGDYRPVQLDGELALEAEHLVLFSEPGKHAFAPTPAWFKERSKRFKRSETKALAGAGGILMAPYIAEHVAVTPLKARLVHTYLAKRGFDPSWDFSQIFRFAPEMLVPWPALRDWMPGRVNAWLDRLEREIPSSDYRFLRIGHRGAAAHAPDNTLRGFRRAADLGADAVEFDVRWTADGEAVLAHDPHLTDDDGRVMPIRRCTLAELQAVDLGMGEHIPTFAEAVGTCKDEQLGVYVEIKDGTAIPTIVDVLRQEESTEYAIVASFRPDWLAEIKALAPELATSILFSATGLDPILLARAVRANYVHPCWERFPNPSALLTQAWVARVREADVGIVCWHEERPEEIAALSRAGVDGICSDAPELLIL